MHVRTSLVGSFPRPYKIGRLMSKYSSGKINKEKYFNILKKELNSVFRRLSKFGVEYVINSMFLWDDIFAPFAEAFDGIKRGGLIRFFDNNFYYRIPIIYSEIEYSKPATLSHYDLVLEISSKYDLKVKAVIPGPYTFITMSDNTYYSSINAAMRAIAKALRKEIETLKRSGVNMVEIHEPMIVHRPPTEISSLIKIYELMLNGLDIFSWVQVYFKSAKKVADILFKLPVSLIGLDLIEDPFFWEWFPEYAKNKTIAIGVVNSRNTLIERASEIKRLVKKLFDLGIKELWITPNAMMDFIPVNIAFKKLRVLGKVRGEFCD